MIRKTYESIRDEIEARRQAGFAEINFNSTYTKTKAGSLKAEVSRKYNILLRKLEAMHTRYEHLMSLTNEQIRNDHTNETNHITVTPPYISIPYEAFRRKMRDRSMTEKEYGLMLGMIDKMRSEPRQDAGNLELQSVMAEDMARIGPRSSNTTKYSRDRQRR